MELHHIHEEYVSKGLYQDSDDELPFGFQVTYDCGPQLKVEEPYLATWHRDHAIELLEEEGYDTLIDYFS
jgi:hypothetical protein